MKKFTVILLLCTLCLSLFCIIPCVAAEGNQFYYIKADTTMILDGNTTIRGTINLPATWYVKTTGKADITEDGKTYKIVEYNGIMGKVDASTLSVKTANITTAPYHNFKVDAISTVGNTPLPLANDSNVTDFIGGSGVTPGSAITVLAKSSSNTNYAISYTQNGNVKIAFVSSALLLNAPFEHIDNINKKDPDQLGGGDSLTPPDTNKDKTMPTNNILRILLIVGVCILAVLLVFLIFKPSAKKAKDDDFYHDYNNK